MEGRRLGHYEVLGPLGEGGMGCVYRARDTRLRREVAIKMIAESLTEDPDAYTRFAREARLLAALNHPNVASIYGLEQDGERRFIAMELVQGETLRERLRQGPIEHGEALWIAHQIAEGLAAAHERGVVHRDLKPANVMVTPAGKVKVLDFGVAKGTGITAGPDTETDVTRSPTIAPATRSGVILGTAPYMSPEQARGRPVDKRTDVWAFGALLYEMLTGKRAFPGNTVSDVLAAILKSRTIPTGARCRDARRRRCAGFCGAA